jgi:hypothetical protein
MIKVSVLSDSVSPRLAYVLSFLNEHPYCKYRLTFELNKGVESNFSISYKVEDSSNSDLHVVPHNYFFNPTQEINLSDLNCSSYNFHNYKIHAFGNADSSKVFKENNKISFDIFENIFFHISRVEETVLRIGKYIDDKLSFEKQLYLIKNSIEKTPVVDELVRALVHSITRDAVSLQSFKILSHDIDHIRLFQNSTDILKKTGGVIYHKKGLKGLKVLHQVYQKYRKEGADPFDTFDWMLSKKEVQKRIYFLVGGNHRWDSTYDLKDEIFNKAIALSKERNYTIGIHPSYNSWMDVDLIMEQKARLEEGIRIEIEYSRQHFLNFDVLETPSLLEKAGIGVDSSLGYTRYTGYRCGTAFPYLLYDFKNEKTSSIKEEPLVFMDMAWLYESERTKDYSIDLDDFNGAFNFHNSFFYEAEQRGLSIKNKYLDFIA